MMTLLNEPQSTILISLYKPIIMFAVFIGWAKVVARFDKDVQALYLPRSAVNGAQLGCGAVALLAWLFIPLFWIGFLVALLLLGGSIFGYVAFRNTKVDENAKWDYGKDLIGGKMEAARVKRLTSDVVLTFLNKDGSPRPNPLPDDPVFELHNRWQHIFEYTATRGGESVTLAVTSERAAAVATIDGVKYPLQELDPKAAMAMINLLKQQGGMDATDMRRRQSGTVYIDLGEDGGRHELSINTVGSSKEVRLTTTFDTEVRTRVSFTELGLLESQQQALEGVTGTTEGVVLVAAPGGHGMSTTLYNLVERHDPYTQSVITLEDDIAFEVEGVEHELIEPSDTPDDIAKKIVVKLRSDPAVFLVSRLFDAQVASVIAEGAESTRFYAGIHQADTYTALRAWIKAVGDAKQAASVLKAIVAQRLVRKLCPTCRVPYKPDPAMLQKLNLPADKVQQLYKHTGKVIVGKKEQTCPDCHGIGYRGRVGVFEVMVLDDGARTMIGDAQLEQARGHLRKQRMLLLQEAALNKVVQGVTSLTEIQRALKKDKSS